MYQQNPSPQRKFSYDLFETHWYLLRMGNWESKRQQQETPFVFHGVCMYKNQPLFHHFFWREVWCHWITIVMLSNKIAWSLFFDLSSGFARIDASPTAHSVWTDRIWAFFLGDKGRARKPPTASFFVDPGVSKNNSQDSRTTIDDSFFTENLHLLSRFPRPVC